MSHELMVLPRMLSGLGAPSLCWSNQHTGCTNNYPFIHLSLIMSYTSNTHISI
uniref:Uncharacterized protein n=1 Tax=Arundo donax TaxID=35708 RepID=A0A0A9H5Z1_ARUDO